MTRVSIEKSLLVAVGLVSLVAASEATPANAQPADRQVIHLGRDEVTWPLVVDNAVIIGTNNADYIEVVGVHNRILGRGGDDEIRVLGGLSEGDPIDQTYNVAHGGPGDDYIELIGEFDLADGGPGNDYLNLIGWNDTARGGPGDDILESSGQRPGSLTRLFGGPGDDYFYVTRGGQFLDGGPGYDRFQEGSCEPELVEYLNIEELVFDCGTQD